MSEKGVRSAAMAWVRGLRLDPAFVMVTMVRYSGPLLLALVAPVLVGDQAAKGLFVLISMLLFGVTLGRLGVDNEILKDLAGSDRKVGLRLTVLAWLPLTGFVTIWLISRWAPPSVVELPVGPGTCLLMYAVLFLNSIVVALEKSQGNTTYVQLAEFGAFQFVLIGVLALLLLVEQSQGDRLDTALRTVAILYSTAIALYVRRNPAPFFQLEHLGWNLIRDRVNCFVPNMITYVSAWGLLLPLAQVPAEEFNNINAALRISTISTAITAIAILLGIKDRSMSALAAFKRCREIAIQILLASSPVVVVGYIVGVHVWSVLPDPSDPFVVTVYMSHIAAIVIGPTMFFANVMGEHRRINWVFAGLMVIVAGVYTFPTMGLWGVMAIVVYTRVVGRVLLLPAADVLKKGVPEPSG